MIEQLLSYHQRLDSKAFVEQLMQRVERQSRLRYRILGSFTLLGIIAGIIGFIKVWPTNLLGYMESLDQVSIILFSCLLAGFATFLFWLLNDEFELP